ncbi:MAG TPA: HAMP domain-containing sensor histidine kinase [Roseiflexaceae bacterium]
MLLANGLLTLVVTLIYFGLSALLSPFFSRRDAPMAYLLATVMIALTIVPVRRRVRALINRLLHRDWQSGQELLRDIGGSLSRTIDPDALCTILVDDLPQRLLIERATLWMLQPPDDLAFVALGCPPRAAGAMLLANGASVGQVRHTASYLLIPAQEEIEWAAPFLARDVRLIIPMRIGERLVGFYGCGTPQQARSYPHAVLELLLMLAPAIASALENARAYATIAQLNEQLRALDQLKDEFIENVGHELRTPLTSLSLTIQILTTQREMTPALAQVMRASLERLEALVDRVLTFDEHTQHSLNDQSAASGSIEIGPLLEAIAAEYALAAQAKGLRLSLLAPSGLAVWGNSARLHRALHEVVDNAVRYSAEGQVTLAAMLQDGLARISITDEGPGIPHEERDRLFAAFFRGRSTRALAETPGAGLGLSIARHDIEALGGRIWLEQSDPGGSMICVAIPAVEAFGEADGNGHMQQRTVGA